MNNNFDDVLLIGFDKSNKDGKEILLVSRRGSKGENVIISGFTGEEALGIYSKLICGGDISNGRTAK